MGQSVGHAVVDELALDGLTAVAVAVAQRVTALHHEAFDDAVEGQSVIEAAVGKLGKVGHRNRSGVAVQIQLDGAVILQNDLCPMGGGKDGGLVGDDGFGVAGELDDGNQCHDDGKRNEKDHPGADLLAGLLFHRFFGRHEKLSFQFGR